MDLSIGLKTDGLIYKSDDSEPTISAPFLFFNGSGFIPVMDLKLPVGKSMSINMGDGTIYNINGQDETKIQIDHNYLTSENHKVIFDGDFEYLTFLEWENNQNINGDFSEILKFTRLERFDIYNTGIYGNTLQINTLQNLSYAKIYITQMSGNLIDFNNNPNLDYLSLRGNFDGNINDISSLSLIDSIYFAFTNITGNISSLINNLSLTTIGLNNLSTINGDISVLNNFPNLFYVSFYGSSNITGDLSSLANKSNLVYAYMASSQCYGDLGFIETCNNLQRLYVNSLTGITYSQNKTIPISLRYIQLQGSDISQIDLYRLIDDLYINKENRATNGNWNSTAGCPGIDQDHQDKLDWFAINKSWTVSYDTV